MPPMPLRCQPGEPDHPDHASPGPDPVQWALRPRAFARYLQQPQPGCLDFVALAAACRSRHAVADSRAECAAESLRIQREPSWMLPEREPYHTRNEKAN